jgi:hypothetical protein
VDPAGSTLCIWDRLVEHHRTNRRGEKEMRDGERLCYRSSWWEELAWRRWQGGSGAADGTSRRWQCHPRDRLGLDGGWRQWQSTSLPEPVAPTPFLYGTVRRGPPTANGLSAPDQGASQGPIRPLGLIGGRSIPTCCSHVQSKEHIHKHAQPGLGRPGLSTYTRCVQCIPDETKPSKKQ